MRVKLTHIRVGGTTLDMQVTLPFFKMAVSKQPIFQFIEDRPALSGKGLGKGVHRLVSERLRA